MSRDKSEEEKTEKLLKRWRRARGGRTLPRSGGGVHEDKKSKKVEAQLADEADDEMRNWKQNASKDFEEDLEAAGGDVLDDEFWDEWKYPDVPEDYEPEESLIKDKEKKDATTD